jgi:hypothetical protein
MRAYKPGQPRRCWSIQQCVDKRFPLQHVASSETKYIPLEKLTPWEWRWATATSPTESVVTRFAAGVGAADEPLASRSRLEASRGERHRVSGNLLPTFCRINRSNPWTPSADTTTCIWGLSQHLYATALEVSSLGSVMRLWCVKAFMELRHCLLVQVQSRCKIREVPLFRRRIHLDREQ